MVLRKSSKIGSTRSAFTTGLTTYGRQTLFLCFHYPVEILLGIVKFDMGIGVRRDADIRMTHDILQGFGIHAAFCHVGTEGVAAHMRGDFRKLYFVDAAVPVYRQRYLPSVRWYSPSRKIRFRLSHLFFAHGISPFKKGEPDLRQHHITKHPQFLFADVIICSPPAYVHFTAFLHSGQ